jgi:hypothetical protein
LLKAKRELKTHPERSRNSNMIPALFFLPQDILRCFTNYLQPESSQNRRTFHYCYDWRNFLNTSKEYFGEWKKESQILVLPDLETKRYRDSAEFRQRINQCVENPRFQVDLAFDKETGNRTILVDEVRKIHVSESDCIESVVLDVDEVSLSECLVKDLSFCSNVKSVTVIQHTLQHTRRCPPVLDFRYFRNIEKGVFKLSRMAVTKNYPVLANLKSLELSGCPAVTDVSCFQNIPHLTLKFCFGITDVSSLGKVHTLSLIGCLNVHEVSALGRVHTMDLSVCNNVTDLSALEWVYSLTFQNFMGADLSGLKNIVQLDISSAKRVIDLSMLQSLQVLNIESCDGISNLNGLSNLKELWVDANRIPSGNDLFQQLLVLHLSHSSRLPIRYQFPILSDFISTLDHLQELTLHLCNIIDFPFYPI